MKINKEVLVLYKCWNSKIWLLSNVGQIIFSQLTSKYYLCFDNKGNKTQFYLLGIGNRIGIYWNYNRNGMTNESNSCVWLNTGINVYHDYYVGLIVGIEWTNGYFDIYNPRFNHEYTIKKNELLIL